MNGTREIKFSVGGVVFSFVWEGSKVVDWPSKLYKPFKTEQKPDVTLVIKCGGIPDTPNGEVLFDADNNWKLYRTQDAYIFEECDVKTHIRDRVIVMKKDLTFGEVYITPDELSGFKKIISLTVKGNKIQQWSIHRVIDPLIKILLSNLLIKNEGVMVHGLSIDDNGKGILFAGRSGAGKSTLAKFYEASRKSCVINDEKTILFKRDGEFWLTGTPWPGDSLISNLRTVPLKKVYFIKHSKENNVFPVDDTEAFHRFFPQLFLPFWDKAAISKMVDFSLEVLGSLKPDEFGFIKDKKAVKYIRSIYGA